MSTENITDGFVPSQGFIEECMRMIEVAQDRSDIFPQLHMDHTGITISDRDCDGDRIECFLSWEDMAMSYAELVEVRVERKKESLRLWYEKKQLAREEHEQRNLMQQRADYERLKAIYEPQSPA